MSSKLKPEAQARLAMYLKILGVQIQDMRLAAADGSPHDRITSYKYVLDSVLGTAFEWLGRMRNRVGYEEADEGWHRLEAIQTEGRRLLVDSRKRPVERRLRAAKAKAKAAAERSARRALSEEAAQARQARQARLAERQERERLRMAALERSMAAREARVEALNRGADAPPRPASSPRRSGRRPRKQPHPKKLDE